ncbi:MAG: addiction module protein [Verrucomicrobia bacterium]|nr:addiction module protein [Verrucomicrobiota bacterium]
MSIQADKLAEQLLTLPSSDRAQVARRLIASLETKTEPTEEVEAAWRQEIAKRTQELDEGLVETTPAGQVIAEIRQRLHDSPAAS